jgi:putative sigma-54 modulation protein
MNIQITCRHSKVSAETKQLLKNELVNLEKYYDRITSCHIILDTEHLDKIVEIVIKVQGATISAKAKADNLGKSVDMAIQKIARQLKKLNEKVKSHKTTNAGKKIKAGDDEA